MTVDPLLRNLRDRLEPSRLAIAGIFLFIVLGYRIFLWQEGPPSLIIVLFLGAHTLGTYILGPAAWVWTDPGRRRRLPNGLFHPLVWNLVWPGLLTAAFLAGERLSGLTPKYPIHLAELSRALGLHPLLIVDLAAAPVTFLAAWLIAEVDHARQLQVEAQERQRALSDNLKAAEARALQAELDPHVLYNALGGLAELVRRDPVQAEQALLDFSSYYRRVTACARKRSISMREERDLLELFLAIERIRFGERLQVAWDWPEALDDRHIPPLLLQPLVENAIKHGIAPAEQGGLLRLELREDTDGIRIVIENSGAPLPEGSKPGHGLSNLRHRLANLTPPGRFRLRGEHGRTRAELLLDSARMEERP